MLYYSSGTSYNGKNPMMDRSRFGPATEEPQTSALLIEIKYLTLMVEQVVLFSLLKVSVTSLT